MRAIVTVPRTLRVIVTTAALATVFIALEGCDSGAKTRTNAPPSAPATQPTAPPTTPPATPTPSGLDSRPSNTSCLAWPRASLAITLTRYAPSLSFTQPVAMVQAPNSAAYWYVVEQPGYVRRFETANPASASVVLDLHNQVRLEGEGGLLGTAFHPNFPSDPRVFLAYTALEGTQFVVRVSSFTSDDGGATLNPASELVLLAIDKPFRNHNGGNVAFGPDGYLYFGIGDGGGGGDNFPPNGNGQRLTTLLGKLLRIDVNVPAATRYAVPPSNPYFDAANPGDQCPRNGRSSGACPEIYAWGLRNPWRWSFDRANGELWLADVGQLSYEEVNLIVKGGNYGWRCREGAHDFASASTPACASAATIDPLAEYGRSDGQSITGGYVYRGTQTTNLLGRYIFADFVSGKIWAWIPENTTARVPTLLLESGLNISSFAEGHDGELYVLHHGGTLHKINFQQSAQAPSAPTQLSGTGCVSGSNPTQPASGLIPYDVNAPFWSDGATKERWIGLPNGQNIVVGADGDWDFPNGTVLVKNFHNATRLIETRLFMRHPDGTWGGFTYEWNAQQTDATLVTGGAVRTIDGQQWIFPSEAQCVQCHTAVAGRTLGLETAQLNKSFVYTQTNRTANQLATLNTIGTLSPPITDPASQPSLPNPTDTTATLASRARAYLHTNCSQCHRPGGPTPSSMDLRYTTTLAATNTCNESPHNGDLGLGVAARLIAPGSAANSIVIARMNRRDSHAMPPVGSNQVDTAGVALLTQWVNGLTGC